MATVGPAIEDCGELMTSCSTPAARGESGGLPLAIAYRAAHDRDMQKRSSKLPRDPNQRAKAIVDLATAEPSTESKGAGSGDQPTAPAKNPAAVELGRLGGLKGGPARKAKLSAKKRKEIAKKAAVARWARKNT